MQAVLAFAAALVALRPGGALVRRWRARRTPELAAWAASLLAYALACGALAWGAAAGWDARAFRAYYLFGGLLTAPLLGVGSLLRAGVRWIGGVGLAYAGLAIGVAVAVPVSGAFAGSGIPPAQDHLDLLPARLLAILGNGLGTLAAVAVAVLTIRPPPPGNGLVLAGVGVAAAGRAAVRLGEAGTAAVFAAAPLLLYLGVSAPAGWRGSPGTPPHNRRVGRPPPRG